MKVCDIVINSIWYDPRVKRQINMYKLCDDIELSCVGVQCARYNEDKVKELDVNIQLVKEPPVKHRYIPRVIWRFYRRWKIDRMLRDAIIEQNPDIIHANDFSALLPAYMASKKIKCKLLYDSHEVYMGNRLPYGKLYINLLKSIERYIAKRVDLMVCVSNAAADYFANEFEMKRPLVITNCTQKDAIIKNKTIKNEGFEVLNHGQFYSGRGYDIVVKAAQLLEEYPNIKMALRGFGTMEQELHNYVSEKEIKNVVFYPPVSVTELTTKAAESHVGVAITEPVCLNFELSVSNKLFEYAAAGLPVIMSDIPEHRYLNQKYHFGVILKDNKPETFAEAVIRLYLDKELYNECSQNAQKLSKDINWENEFGKLINLERNLVNHN